MSDADPPPSVLRALPLTRWARRLARGRVDLRGHLTAPLAGSAATGPHPVPAGPVEIDLDFVGGDPPRLTRLQIRHGGGDHAQTDPDPAWLSPLVDALHDVALKVVVHADDDIVLELGKGLQAVMQAGGQVQLSVCAQGPPNAPTLAGPLELDIADPGLQLVHGSVPGLSRMARLRVQRLALHPSGQVTLDGGGRGVLDLAVDRGLRKLAGRLSELVRESPRFERVRAFLPHTG